MYKRIDVSHSARVFVVGDLHGCYDLLMAKMKEVNFDYDADVLISVGDLVDRGDKNLECLRLLDADWFHCVMGNHERMAIDKLYGLWVMNGGQWYYGLGMTDRAETDVLLDRAAQLPICLEVNYRGRKHVFCHADYPHNEYEYDKPIDPDIVLWDRTRIYDARYHGENSVITGADVFYFGHTPVRRALRVGNLCYVDTGAVYNGNLTLMELV